MQILHLLLSHPLIITPILLFLTFFLTYTQFSWPQNSKRTRLPPSPRKLPFIGNLHQLGSLPHRSLLTLSKNYGPLMLLQLGQKPTLIVSSPELAQVIMKDQDNIFANRPSLKIPTELLYHGKDIAFAPYSEYWRQVRKVAVLHLLSNKRVQSYRAIREEEIATMIDKVLNLSPQGTLDLTEILNLLAKDMISRIAVGKCVGESDFVGKLMEEVNILLGSFHWGDYFPRLAWISRLNGMDNRVKKAFEKSDKFLNRIVERQQALYCNGEVEKGNPAFVDVLLSLQEELNKSLPFNKQNIKALVEDMFIGGTDSTYITMEWVMAELIRNPNAMAKLKQEIQCIVGSQSTVTEENLPEMNYLKAVIKETLRLHPPGTLLIPRESMENTEVQGYIVPKNTRVLINVWAIGRDSSVWESPEEFLPERFLGSDIDFRGHDCRLLPFGAGRRICPAIQFAMVMVELAITNLLHRFDWKLPGNMKGEDIDMEEAPGLDNRKKINLQVIATPCF